MVHADSHRISRVLCYSGYIKILIISFQYRTFTFYGYTFQNILFANNLTFEDFANLLLTLPLPNIRNGCALDTYIV